MRKSKNLYIVSLLISLITILVYLPALQNDFVNWDDNKYVYDNPYIRSFNFESIKWMLTSFYAANWHPLTWLSHTVDYAIWGLNPLGHHLTSVILHGVNTFLVVILINNIINLTKNNYKKKTILIVGAVTGFLFGLHPIHVESVAWVSERKDLLCAFFFFLSIFLYLKYVSCLESKQKQKYYLICLLVYILSLMSKPMAITLPIVLIILDFYPLERYELGSAFKYQRKVLIEKVPFLVLSFGSSVITIFAQKGGGAVATLQNIPIWDRVLVALRSHFFYMYKILWPSNLVPLYPYPDNISFFMVEYVFSFVFILSLTSFCIYSLRQRKEKVWLALWTFYLVTLLPVSGIIQIGNQAAADRYTYIPSIGPFIIIGFVVAIIWRSIIQKKRLLDKWVFLSISLAVTLILIGTTVKQTRIWKDSITLWSEELKIYPRVALVYNNLGNAYQYKGLIQNAIEQFQIAIKLDPYFARAHYNLGNAYISQGVYSKAIRHYKIASKDPDLYLMAYNNLGNTYLVQGFTDKAIEQYKTVLLFKPEFSTAHHNIGLAYQSQGFIDEAIMHFKSAIKFNPGYTTAHYNLALAYKSKGLMEKANQHFSVAQRLNPALFDKKNNQQ